MKLLFFSILISLCTLSVSADPNKRVMHLGPGTEFSIPVGDDEFITTHDKEWAEGNADEHFVCDIGLHSRFDEAYVRKIKRAIYWVDNVQVTTHAGPSGYRETIRFGMNNSDVRLPAITFECRSFKRSSPRPYRLISHMEALVGKEFFHNLVFREEEPPGINDIFPQYESFEILKPIRITRTEGNYGSNKVYFKEGKFLPTFAPIVCEASIFAHGDFAFDHEIPAGTRFHNVRSMAFFSDHGHPPSPYDWWITFTGSAPGVIPGRLEIRCYSEFRKDIEGIVKFHEFKKDEE